MSLKGKLRSQNLQMSSSSKWQTPGVITLELVGLWVVLSNYLAKDLSLYSIPTPISYGALNFFFLIGFCVLILIARFVAIPQTTGRQKRRSTGVACFIGVLLIAICLVRQARTFSSSYNDPVHSDLTINTWTADRNVFDLDQNPYTTDCQLWHNPANALHVTRIGRQLYMFGVPYDFGYAYFPAMFISYEPFRHIVPSYKSIRVANAVFYLATLAAMAWLVALLVPRKWRVLGAIMAVAAFAVNQYMGWEYYFLGTVDVVIPLFTLLGFIAAYYDRPMLAGLFFGWAFACKLLPGGFICLIVGAYYWRRPERWQFWGPMVATFVVVVLPYVLKNPPAFFSATVLYYLTEHAHGDRSALYFFLPSWAQATFLIGGYLLCLAMLILAMRRKDQTLLGAIGSCFIVFVIFMAFSKLSHDNYFFAIAPLGAVALIGYALRNLDSSAKDEAPQLTLDHVAAI